LSGPEATFVRLLDMKGKEVFRTQTNSEIQLPQDLKSGTYLLQVHSTTLISNHQIIVID
jgi:hypothetical protein